MKKPLTIILFLYSNLILSQKISNYYKAVNSKSHKEFYWDLCKDYKLENVLKGVVYEKVYHCDNNGKDSSLEKEIFYTKDGKLLKEFKYGIVSKKELIRKDSFIYNNNLLISEIIYQQGYFENTIDTIIKTFTYDSLEREIYVSIKTEIGRIDSISTTYIDSNRIKEVEIGYGRSYGGWKQNYFYSSNNKVDSIRFSLYKQYTHSVSFKYNLDSSIEREYWLDNGKVKLIKEIYYNDDKTIASLFLEKEYYGYNWNKVQKNNLLIKIFRHQPNILDCVYFINGYKRYSKKHYYYFKD